MRSWSNGPSNDPGRNMEDEQEETQGESGRTFPVRLMGEDDLPLIIEIDAKGGGISRPRYFEEKIDACIREPGINISLVAESDGLPVGFLLGLLFLGEFGVPSTRAVVHTIGVHPAFAHQGVAHALLEQFRRNLQALRIDSIHTLLNWDAFELLHFFKSTGFRPGREVDLVWDSNRFPFSGGHTEVVLEQAAPGHLETVASIDAEMLNRRRRRYFETKLESSLKRPGHILFRVGKVDGEPAGFLVAGLYEGEFGIEEARGVIDSFGVREKYRHHGVASTLLEGMLNWLKDKQVHQVETLCRWNDWELLRFFEYVGFRPSSRLNLEWRFT